MKWLMNQATTFIIAVIAYVSSAAAATAPLVKFESSCVCHNNHGVSRWSVKTDPSLPPANTNAIQTITPSVIFSWAGPGVHLTQSSKRIAAENKWYALTGRIVAMKVEADGDVHVALQDATGNKPGSVVVEVPAKPIWCPIRKVLFGLTKTKFPFNVRADQTLTISHAPVITVTGKAFFDITHAPKDQSNKRTDLAGYAAWEIHPVMKVKM
jgi:hypothetical protein